MAEPYSKKNPFPSPLLVHKRLNGEGSAKDTRHFELGLEGSGLEYLCGDSLGVFPQNCPEYVEELLKTLGCDGEEAVAAPDGTETSLRQAMEKFYNITIPSKKFLVEFSERANDFMLQNLLRPEMKQDLQKYLYGREIIDLFTEFPEVKYTAQEFVEKLGKLLPRLYSIASSPKAHEGEVHLTIARVEYESFGRSRKGVCSTYLSDRVADGATVDVFVHPAKGFKPPVDDSAPMIMVGPGTGIAPFRAFLEERQVTGASGKNWLFFGNPNKATDFFYEEDFTKMQEEGVLTKFDIAWSRDQAEKVYVQHKIQENAAEIWKWLDEGGHFYVCGDAVKMAGDVDVALHDLIQKHGGLSEEGAIDYVKEMKKDKRYQRDVY